MADQIGLWAGVETARGKCVVCDEVGELYADRRTCVDDYTCGRRRAVAYALLPFAVKREIARLTGGWPGKRRKRKRGDPPTLADAQPTGYLTPYRDLSTLQPYCAWGEEGDGVYSREGEGDFIGVADIHIPGIEQDPRQRISP